MRQAKEVAYNLAKAAPLEASFHIHSNITFVLNFLLLMKSIKLFFF